MEGLFIRVIGNSNKNTLCHFDTEGELLDYILSLSYDYDVIVDNGVIILSEKS